MFSVFPHKSAEMLQLWCCLASSTTTWRLWREKPGRQVWSALTQCRIAGTTYYNRCMDAKCSLSLCLERKSDTLVKFPSLHPLIASGLGRGHLLEVFLVPAVGDVRLGAAGALETAKSTSLSDERWTWAVEFVSIQRQCSCRRDWRHICSQVCHQSSMLKSVAG